MAADPFEPVGVNRLTRWTRDHRRVVGESLHFVSARLGTSLLVWLLVGIALALPAGFFLVQQNLQDISADWDGRPGLSVYFRLGATGEEVLALKEVLATDSAVLEVVHTTPEQALEEFHAHSGLGDALEFLEQNPLPASLRASLQASASVLELELLADKARQASGVEDVVVEKTWLERVHDITIVVQRLSLLLALLFGLGAILVTATSVRLAIEGRLEELKVQKLVGATDGQIRRPFLYFGAIYGTGGAVVALMLISVALMVVEQPLERLFGSYGGGLELSGFNPTFLGALIAVGCVLGVIGALAAARQRLEGMDVL